MSTGLLVLILAALIVLSIGVGTMARKMPGPEMRELVRVRTEGALADEHLTRVTAECMQAMLDAARGHRHSEK
jgi:hypothetical protein